MRIAMVGDVMLGRLVNENLVEQKPEHPWGDTLSLLRTANFRLCNLECAISDIGEPWSATPKEFHFRSDAKNVKVLSAAGINVVSLANNHALDYGYDALVDTVRILDQAGIKHSGAGSNLTEAERPAVLDLEDGRIGVISFTDNDPDWEAGSDKPGIFYVPIDLEDYRASHLLELIRQTKKKVDCLIVSVHWGPNWGYEPPAEHIPFSHVMVDAGTDVILGHSGHVFRGLEIYRDEPIIYCAGDFVDDYAVDPIERNDEASIFMLDIDKHAILGLRIYPAKIDFCRARLARGGEVQLIAKKLQRLSAKFGTLLEWNDAEGSLELKP